MTGVKDREIPQALCGYLRSAGGKRVTAEEWREGCASLASSGVCRRIREYADGSGMEAAEYRLRLRVPAESGAAEAARYFGEIREAVLRESPGEYAPGVFGGAARFRLTGSVRRDSVSAAGVEEYSCAAELIFFRGASESAEAAGRAEYRIRESGTPGLGSDGSVWLPLGPGFTEWEEAPGLTLYCRRFDGEDEERREITGASPAIRYRADALAWEDPAGRILMNAEGNVEILAVRGGNALLRRYAVIPEAVNSRGSSGPGTAGILAGCDVGIRGFFDGERFWEETESEE